MAGKYRAYPEYRDSGVEWLGEIPIGWEVKKLKYLCKVKTGDKDTVNAVEDGLYPFFVRSQTVERIDSFSADCEAVLTAGDGVGVGKVFHYHFGKFDFHQRVYMLSNFYKVTGRFLYYYLSNNFYKVALDGNAKSTVDSLRLPQFLNFEFSVPGISEQTNVTNFLDHETAKIDTLIEKQQQLIQLLKEKRQAVISHAVTKGLNPDVPMKDSGVEWLGEVPAGWVVARLKYHANLFEQGWSPQCDSRPAEDDEYGVLKVGCVNHGAFNCDENKALPRDLEPQLQYLLRKEDLLISRANTKELVGSAAVVDGDYDNLLLCDKLYRIRFDHLIVPQLVAYYLGLPIVRRQIELEASGASHSMQNIGQSTIKELPIVIPPRDEADALVIKIQEKVHVFNSIHKKVSDQIGLLQERRTALISAAVTGKIDVRLHASHPTGSA